MCIFFFLVYSLISNREKKLFKTFRSMCHNLTYALKDCGSRAHQKSFVTYVLSTIKISTKLEIFF